MEIVISKDLLTDALNKVSKFIPVRATHPILEYIKLSVEEDCFKLEATDLNNSIKIKLKEDFEIIQEGTICVPARLITEIVSKTKDDTIKLITNGTVLEIESNSYKFKINGIDIEEYPAINYLEEHPGILLKGSLFKRIDKHCRPFCSNELTLGCIQGINLKLSPGESIGASTDGHRLTRYTDYGHSIIEEGDLNFTLQAGALVELVKNIKDEEDDVIVKLNETISLEINNTVINSRLLEGSYPKVETIIPNHFNFEFHVNRKELIQALDLINVFSKENKDVGILKLDLNPDSNSVYITLSCEVGDIGNGVSSLEGVFSDCRELEERHKPLPFSKIGINTKYFLSLLKVLDEDIIIIKLNGAIDPIVLTTYEREFDSIDLLLMPIQLRN